MYGIETFRHMSDIQKREQIIWKPQYLDSLFTHWWTHLQQHNREISQTKCLRRTSPFTILSPALVEVVFVICTKLQQPAEVRFLALELLDRFMMYHYEQLHLHIWQKDNRDSVLKERQWSRVIDRVRNQLLLRVLSCIQLASKVSTSYKKLSPLAVMEFLKSVGHKFTIQSIMASERRVFRTLEFKIPLSNALTYVEMLLSCLYGTAVDLDAMHSVSTRILDIVYLRHQDIYMRLLHKITGRICPTPSERKQFEEVECDNIYMACAVLTSAARLLNIDTIPITACLQKLVKLEESDIRRLSSIITHIVLE